MGPKEKKAATPGKKEDKPEAKKPAQEKKPKPAGAAAPAKAKKEGTPKPATTPSKKKDPATKPAEGAKAKDKGKKRKLNETSQAKPKQGAESKKKKVEKKVQAKKTGAKGQTTTLAKKPIKKQLKPKTPAQLKTLRRKKLARQGKSEIVVYEGRRYFLLPCGKMKAMLDIKLDDNDKVAKVDNVYIRKCDVKAYEEFKESIKTAPPNMLKRKLRLKQQVLKRQLMKELVKEAKGDKKPAMATAADAELETKVMTMYKGTWVRKKAVPRILSYAHNKTIKLKQARKEKGPKELTEEEKKIFDKFMKKILQDEHRRLRKALLSTRPSVAKKIAGAKKQPAKKPAKSAAAKKPDAAKTKSPAGKGGEVKKQKRPAKKEKAAAK